MATDDQSGSAVRAVGDIRNYMENGAWCKHQRIPGLQTQLLFNLATPTNVLNRATRVGPPGPIVIEKFRAHREPQDVAESGSSSLHFSVLSEERLQAAVRLAQKDLRRKRQGFKNSLSHKTRTKSPSLDHQNDISTKSRQRTGSPKRHTKPCTQVLVCTPQKLFQSSRAEHGQSPPTRDPGPKAISSEPQLSREIHKLQKELETYVKRIEQLVNKGQIVESVEPDETRRLEIRQQEQAARSARIIYVLQQQVKEIQEDIEKLRSQSVRPTNKSRAVNRLAAAHRGAVRAMQAFIQQLSDPAVNRVPVQCKELGQLIRQLSLCSAKVEVGHGSAVPETTLDILQKLETLDLALRKQDNQQDHDPHTQSISPVRQRISKVSGRSTPHSRFPQAQTVKTTWQPKKSSAPRKNRRTPGQPFKVGQLLDQERKEVLKVGIQNLVRMWESRERKSGNRPETDIPKSSNSASHSDKSKPCGHVRDAGFQQPTVSSKLRESQLPQRDASVPWIPTSPHSPVKHRALSRRPEPRCLFSPIKDSSLPLGVQGKSPNQGKTSSENIRDAQNEALRQAWLDTITENGEREVNHLSEEEMGAVQRVRAEAGSPTQGTNGAMHITRDAHQPLPDCVQTAVSKDVEAGAMQEVSWEHDMLLQDPLLDNMLLRMEEIEKDEEEVRRRFAMISYSDPLLWDIDTATNRKHNSSRPASPQPIRLTKPAQRCSTTGDIVLKKPVETGVGSESLLLDEESPAAVPSGLNTEQAQRKGGIRLNVPCSIQKNVQKYREEHDSYLRRVCHAAVGSFKPWAVAESLAEELIMEALTDVAAEFQDVCEEYAEAIFTSEFLQPNQPTSVS